MEESFYDIVDQSKYRIIISKPKKMEELSDLFITREELDALVGGRRYINGEGPHQFTLRSEITAAVKTLTEKLDASKKKTIPIDDEELVDILKENYLSDFTDGTDAYGRFGDRICYARQYKRKKTKATQTDVYHLWGALSSGFNRKFSTWPPHIPKYDRHIRMFKAFKKIVGWRQVRASANKEEAKFYRQIWDNPEEYM